jgi:hypothetical protein
MSLSIQPPYPVVNDTDGQPLENGYIWIGAANLNPQTNPISIYWDAALTQPAAQPVRTQGGYPSNAGTPGRLYTAQNYSILVQNSRGVTLYSAPQQTELYGTASGGTGLTSYVVGDLLYADGTASLARLADVATGNVLRSGGVATAPAWGKVDLTTDVTGVLPSANVSLPDATDSIKGVVELATDAEVQTGTDTTRSITPASLRGGALVLETKQTPSAVATAKFVGIPSWAKRVTVLFDRVSSSGTDLLTAKIFTASSVAASAYRSGAMNGSSSGINFEVSSSLFILEPTNAAGAGVERSGSMVLETVDGNTWVYRANIYSATAGIVNSSAGQATLGAALGEIEIGWTGSDQFDAPSVLNIMYE